MDSPSPVALQRTAILAYPQSGGSRGGTRATALDWFCDNDILVHESNHGIIPHCQLVAASMSQLNVWDQTVPSTTTTRTVARNNPPVLEKPANEWIWKMELEASTSPRQMVYALAHDPQGQRLATGT
jgi:hypothetical protein